MERKRRAHQRSAARKCRSEAGVMSDPVGGRADGVKGSPEGARGQDTRKAENCIGFVEDRLHGLVRWVAVMKGRGEDIVSARLHHR
jgi:hypothetical protein